MFRSKYKVMLHIQYLMFGQFIPRGGFKPQEENKLQTLKSMKTERLVKDRQEQMKKQSDEK